MPDINNETLIAEEVVVETKQKPCAPADIWWAEQVEEEEYPDITPELPVVVAKPMNNETI